MNYLTSALRKIGLSTKESNVYLAMLELGPSVVSEISKKSGVKRASVYVAVESLTRMGLVSSYKFRKKTLFQAESPSRIVSLWEIKENEIKAQKEVLNQVILDLKELQNISVDGPKVTYFEGTAGLTAIQKDLINSGAESLENIVSLDDVKKIQLGDNGISKLREELERRSTVVRILYSSSGEQIDLPSGLEKKWFVKRLSSKRKKFHGEITVYGDKVAIISYKGKIFGLVIEGDEVAAVFRTLFDIAWENNKKEA
jgi:sugar-specific transcriptional regulator TrmB